MDRYIEFASNHALLTMGLLLSFFLLVFTELQRKARSMTSVEPPDAVKLINADAIVVDLRSAEAFAKGHIVNAKNIPLDEFEANSAKLENLKDKSVIAVCDAGTSTARADDRLRKSGMDTVYGLKGGMNAWSQAGLPVVSGKKSRKKS